MNFLSDFMLLDTNIYLKTRLLSKCENALSTPVNKKETHSEFNTYFEQLLNSPVDFREHTRFDTDTFFYVLNLIRPHLESISDLDESISPEEKLFFTLRYLSTGVSFRSLAVPFGLYSYAPEIIISETCNAILNELLDHHMPYPSKQLFYNTSQRYESLYNFPNCIGCIDCKYIRVKNHNQGDPPTYLQVVVDADCRFTCAEIVRDDHDKIFSSSDTYNRLQTKTYDMPAPVKISLQNSVLPYVLLGGKGYPLKQYLLRPYKILKKNKKEEEVLFNDTLAVARHPIQCAFSLLISKWCCLTTELHSNLLDKIVKVCCLLHNILIDKEGLDSAALPNFKDYRNRFGFISNSRRFNSPERGAILTRNLFKQYISLKYQRNINN